MENYSNIVKGFEMLSFSDIGVISDHFVGMKISHVYRAILNGIMDDLSMNPIERFMIFVLRVAVKSRILTDLINFKDKAWYGKVFRFFNEKCSQ